ncbi:unnamed protein product [Nesidiocoris tenuis]|uniref:Uncharacterized protein n=1 Tax=Nesidiocoris tenuis TaxID=355587 RepID=A0A6H5H5L2_9HEMI|nr:unnamed protein product [Nesidiocoris tenuis]
MRQLPSRLEGLRREMKLLRGWRELCWTGEPCALTRLNAGITTSVSNFVNRHHLRVGKECLYFICSSVAKLPQSGLPKITPSQPYKHELLVPQGQRKYAMTFEQIEIQYSTDYHHRGGVSREVQFLGSSRMSTCWLQLLSGNYLSDCNARWTVSGFAYKCIQNDLMFSGVQASSGRTASRRLCINTKLLNQRLEASDKGVLLMRTLREFFEILWRRFTFSEFRPWELRFFLESPVSQERSTKSRPDHLRRPRPKIRGSNGSFGADRFRRKSFVQP